MKRILQIFSVMLLACLAVVVFGMVNQQKAYADNAYCRWVNASQLRCVRLSGNPLEAQFEQTLSSFGAGVGAIEQSIAGDPTIDSKISDLVVALDIKGNCTGAVSASCDDLFFDPNVSNGNQAVFYNSNIGSGDFQNNRIVCKTYQVPDPKDSTKQIAEAGNLCQETDTSGNAKPDAANSTVLVGAVTNATTPDGNFCGVTNITLKASCTSKVDGNPVVGSADTPNPFLDAIKTTQAAMTAQKNTNGACVNSPLSFFLCPLSDFVTSVLQGLIKNIQNILVAPALTGDIGPSSNLGNAVNSIRNIANAAYGIVFLIIIFANFIAIPGMDNYTIKKLLPRLIFVIIITQFAFLVCSVIVDAGNIIGNTVPNTIALAYSGGKNDATALIAQAFNPFATINNGISSGNTSQITAGILEGIGAWLFGFVFYIIALIVVVIAFCYLIFRYLGLVVLVVISPLALAAWVLPNTEGFTKWWITNFFKLVAIYPLFMLLLVMAAIAADIFSKTSSTFGALIAAAMPLIALALIPKIFKLSGNLVSSAGKSLSGIGKEGQQSKAGQFARNAAKKSAQEGKLAEVKGNAMQKFGGKLPGNVGLGFEARGGALKYAPKKATQERVASLGVARQLQLSNEKGPIGDAARAVITDKKRQLLNSRVLDAQQLYDLESIQGKSADEIRAEHNISADNGKVITDPSTPGYLPGNSSTVLNPYFFESQAPQTQTPAAPHTPPPFRPPSTPPGVNPTPPASGPPNTPPSTPPTPPSAPPTPPTIPGGFT